MKPTQIDPEKAEDAMYNHINLNVFGGATLFDKEDEHSSIVTKIGLDAEETPQISISLKLEF
jgi:hypothetical protein